MEYMVDRKPLSPQNDSEDKTDTLELVRIVHLARAVNIPIMSPTLAFTVLGVK